MASGRIPVGILGATGMVGQRFIQLLEHHPWFEVSWIAASERSEGLAYAEAARWKMNTPVPGRIAKMTLASAVTPPGHPRVIFAALEAAIARELEPAYASAGHWVVTNSSALRMAPDVPLVIPEVNPDHLAMLDRQPWRTRGGAVVTNPNCSAIGLVMALAPLRELGLEKLVVTTMQAVSGAGFPGVASLDILGNVVPYIAKEEEKMAEETQKLLGSLRNGVVEPAPVTLSAHCNRVAVEDGHLETVSLKLQKPSSAEDLIQRWSTFRAAPQELELPSAPQHPVIYDSRPDRPQPRLDIHRERGMATIVGRLRPCSIFDWKFTLLSHNTIRGAAGAAILNAELLKARGYLDRLA